jgi:hypothetical protein
MVRLAATATATHPIASLRAAVQSALSVAKLVMPARKPISALMTGRSNDLCLDVASMPVDTLRAAGKQAGGSLNDAFVSVVLDAVDRYHDSSDANCEQIRIHMPINIRNATAGDRSGNQFVPARIVMPISRQSARSQRSPGSTPFRLRSSGSACRSRGGSSAG